MKILDDLKAFFTKNGMLTIAIAIALGFAIIGVIKGTYSSLIEPLLYMITGGRGLEVMDLKYFKLGSFLKEIIEFGFIIAALYFVFGILWKCDGSTAERKESAPPPPPPAPPV
jgi:large-conductance mechanosensitive channel